MTAFSRNLILRVALLLLGATAAVPAGAMPIAILGSAATGGAATIQPAAMGDLPTVPRRRGGRQSKAKDKPYQPLAKDPAGESEAAHKEYLKRYGF